MINGNAMLNPSLPSPRDVASLVALLELLADPKATQTRLDEFAAAADGLRGVIADLEQAQKNLAAERETLEKTIAAEKQAVDTLANSREAIDRQLADRTRELDDREAGIAKREELWKSESEAAAALRKDLEGRLKKMQAIVA
jgi:chromosome segregation ATPase